MLCLDPSISHNAEDVCVDHINHSGQQLLKVPKVGFRKRYILSTMRLMAAHVHVAKVHGSNKPRNRWIWNIWPKKKPGSLHVGLTWIQNNSIDKAVSCSSISIVCNKYFYSTTFWRAFFLCFTHIYSTLSYIVHIKSTWYMIKTVVSVNC